MGGGARARVLYPILQACVPYDEQRLQGDLASLIEAGLVSPIKATKRESYTFKHALVLETAYDSMLKRTRQDHHGAVRKNVGNTLSAVR